MLSRTHDTGMVGKLIVSNGVGDEQRTTGAWSTAVFEPMTSCRPGRSVS